MPMYNLLEHIFCDNYSMTLGGLPNYYRVETNDEDENDNNCNKINNNKAAANKSFKYKTKIQRVNYIKCRSSCSLKMFK